MGKEAGALNLGMADENARMGPLLPVLLMRSSWGVLLRLVARSAKERQSEPAGELLGIGFGAARAMLAVDKPISNAAAAAAANRRGSLAVILKKSRVRGFVQGQVSVVYVEQRGDEFAKVSSWEQVI